MGILNATPDSFHSESRVTVATAVNTARRMAEEGADITDIGAQSTRPGRKPALPANGTDCSPCWKGCGPPCLTCP